MATMAVARRSAARRPFRLLATVARDSTFVVSGIPVQLAGLAALVVPWATPYILPVSAWQVLGVTLLSVALAVALRAPLTAIERHRCWSLLGIDIPRVPAGPGRSLPQRLAGSARSEANWRQLLYHLVAGPALALGGLLTLLAWTGGAGLLIGAAYPHVFAPHDQAPPSRARFWIAVAGIAVLLAAPLAARATAWLDQRAAVALLGPSRSRELERRVETLAESRAGVVDAADAERRRIERDLHDGAQQRLVSLAMNLGMARVTMTDLPPDALRVIVAAHEEAKEALVELRTLVRGLHPAVLDDRGLDAALSGIAARAPLPVRLTVSVPERASPTIEAVAYFVVSECLANIARHSGARQAEIDVRRAGGLLRIRVTDDGVGGADPAHGTGLASLAHRAGSVDGVLQVRSPAGGPTIVTVELPCES
jgi:signal transduction histidine kinase